MNKQRFLDYVTKARIIKKGNLTKKELNNIYAGIEAVDKLGAFENPNWIGGR